MTAAWPSWIWTAIAAPVANHLWQSTLFAAAAWLLTLTLSHHRAQLRHGIWLAASVKFLVPFAALLTLGRHLGWPSAVHVQADMALALDAVSEPFSRPRPSACTGREAPPAAPAVPRLVDPNNDLEAISPPPCGVVRTRRGTLVARGVTMEGLAMGGLSTILDRKVVDRTGLTGTYDVTAEWTPAPGPPKPAGVGPATLIALDEQLGLKLDAAEGPINILVIDRIEHPVER